MTLTEEGLETLHYDIRRLGEYCRSGNLAGWAVTPRAIYAGLLIIMFILRHAIATGYFVIE